MELKYCRLLDRFWSGYHGILLLSPIEGSTVSSHAFTGLHYPDKCGESSGLLLPRPGIHCWTILFTSIFSIGVGSYALPVQSLIHAIRPRNGIR